MQIGFIFLTHVQCITKRRMRTGEHTPALGLRQGKEKRTPTLDHLFEECHNDPFNLNKQCFLDNGTHTKKNCFGIMIGLKYIAEMVTRMKIVNYASRRLPDQ